MKIKESVRFGLRSAGWTLLQIGFILLLFYAVTRSFWMALLCVLLVLLAGNAASKSQANLSLSRQHEVRERMDSFIDMEAGEDLEPGDALYLDKDGKARKAKK